MFRAYDLNEVGRYYRTDPDVQNQLRLYPDRVDYSDPSYADMIMVNFWCDRDGLSLEIYENGRQLTENKETGLEDPLYNISHYVPAAKRTMTYQRSHDHITNHHMYTARTSHPDSTVEIMVKDITGNTIYKEKMVRPKPFDKYAK